MAQNLPEALEIFRTLGAIHEQAIILQLMASNARAKKDPLAEVENLYQQAQQYYSKINDPFGMGVIYWDLAGLYFNRGKLEQGFDAYQKMRHIFEELGNQNMVAESLSWESLWAARFSTFEHAVETRQRSVDLYRKFGTQAHYYWNIFEMGEIYRVFGYPKKALEFYEEAGAQFKKINLVLGLGYCQRALGDIAMLEERYADALRRYEHYYTLAEQDNHMWSMAHAHVKLAWADAHLGEIERARNNTHRCLDSLRGADETGVTLLALLCEARCRAAEGKFEAAATLAAFVATHPVCWKEFRDLAKILLVDLSKNLADAELQAANKQFQGRDLNVLVSEWLADYEAGRFAAG
jgi:tetratricopeptide (TPR) repeat protein